MKVYVLEYDFHVVTIHGEKKEAEHRIKMFSDTAEFIKEVKRVMENNIHEIFGIRYIENIKTYSGEVEEINPKFVINPF